METGLFEDDVNLYNASVRLVSPDSGTEAAIIDFLNIVPQVLRGVEVDYNPDELGYLFPNAFWLPEGNHIWDLLQRRACASIPWWDEFLSELRALVSFFRDETRRGLIFDVLVATGSPNGVAFDKTPTSVFQLRWGTVYHSPKDVLVMIPGLDEVWDPRLYPASSKETSSVD